jgi:hypothetical protein
VRRRRALPRGGDGGRLLTEGMRRWCRRATAAGRPRIWLAGCRLTCWTWIYRAPHRIWASPDVHATGPQVRVPTRGPMTGGGVEEEDVIHTMAYLACSEPAKVPRTAIPSTPGSERSRPTTPRGPRGAASPLPWWVQKHGEVQHERSGRGEEEGACGEGCLGATGGGWGEVLGFDGLQLLFIRRKHDLSHPFDDERSKVIRLFGPKWACYNIPPLLNIFLFLFYFFAIWK